MHALAGAWTDVLKKEPASDSKLEHERSTQGALSTERVADPIDQVWIFAQVLGEAIDDHYQVIHVALLEYAHSGGPQPVISLETLSRTALELSARQAWLIDPKIDARERVGRWYGLLQRSERSAWNRLHLGMANAPPVAANPELATLTEAAGQLGFPANVPDKQARELVDLLLIDYQRLAGKELQGDISLLGSHMYSLLSGGSHADAGHIINNFLARGVDVIDGVAQVRYVLDTASLWRLISVALLATFVSRLQYAEWIGVAVEHEPLRLHKHHIEYATSRALGMTSP